MVEPLTLARTPAGANIVFLPAMANRHGLITGATGTGKTVTLQVLAEYCSSIGVPSFLADVKGDLSGLAAAGELSPKLADRLKRIHVEPPAWRASPVAFWDVFGRRGISVRATISDMGPLLISRLLGLNDTQHGVLTIVFKVADDSGLLLLDLKDLRTMLQFVGDNSRQFTTGYGNISGASIGAIQRGLLALEQQGGGSFFGEPMLDIDDLIQTDTSGRGVLNILAADELVRAPKTYATFLLWLLSEIFERLPEVGDLETPKLVFFFDEAHLLFSDAPAALVGKVEQVVRLIRSKGVGVYFITQSPGDIPETVLAQLGNRVQHALRAFTPHDEKAVKTAADTLRPNPKLNTRQAITELAVGEALVSLLDASGSPGIVERGWIVPPASRIGPLSDAEREAIQAAGVAMYGHYGKGVDRESAYEMLKSRTVAKVPDTGSGPSSGQPAGADPVGTVRDILLGRTGPRGGHHEGLLESAAKSVARSLGSGVGRAILRGTLGSILRGSGR